MPKLKALTLDNFEFITGQQHYTWPIEGAGKVALDLFADSDMQVYAVLTPPDGETEDRYFPIGNGSKLTVEYRLDGSVTAILIRTKRTTQLACLVEFVSDEAADPLDYTPVQIDQPADQQERHMLQVLLEEKLRSIGLDPDRYDMPEEGDDLDDLEFFDDDGDMPATAFQSIDEMAAAQRHEEKYGSADDETVVDDEDSSEKDDTSKEKKPDDKTAGDEKPAQNAD